MRLDDLARTATDSLLAETIPDVESRLADLKRTRRNRAITRAVAASAAVAVVVGGWTVLQEGDRGDGRPEPAGPTYRNGALVIADSNVRVLGGDLTSLVLPKRYQGDGDVAFTADGSELLYLNSDQRIEAIDVDTGENRVIAPCSSQWSCSTALSPDGRWLAQPEDGGIRLREVGGDGDELLATPGVQVEDVAWSPDGETLAFSSPIGIHVMSASDSGAGPRSLAELTEARTAPGRLQWSPDGSAIAFLEARPLGFEQGGLRPERFWLRLVEPDGGGLRDLQALGACSCVRHPAPDFAWAPDGTSIAATRVEARRDFMADARTDGVHLITLDGSTERIGGGPAGSLAWQPVPTGDAGN